MNRFKIETTKQLHDELSVIDFNEVTVSLKALGCTISLDCEDEKDHNFIIEMKIPEENQMNIDKLETQSEPADTISSPELRLKENDLIAEWSNGDECLYMNSSEVHKFIGIDPTRNDLCYIKASCSAVNWVEIAKLSKPETQEAKEKRERLEAAYDLYISCNSESHVNKINATYEWFICSKIAVDYWLAIVDKTNYHKGVK